MARLKRHWQPPGAAGPRARCGAWIGTALVTRDPRAVTCGRCRRLMPPPDAEPEPPLEIRPIRGRPVQVEYSDGGVEVGMLVNAVDAGLALCRRSDGKRVVADWTRIETARFLDEPEREAEAE